ncbi:MAG TPA: hypothetical protein VNE62_04370 [Actinomycetota bacterium]|nr:hypothetical protein [Actinomycetota bacterium]
MTADDAGVEDRVVWDALIRLGSADLGGEPEEYLYFESDFHAWLDEVEDAIDSPS